MRIRMARAGHLQHAGREHELWTRELEWRRTEGTVTKPRDKVAIVTGAAQRIGRAYALRFAREGARDDLVRVAVILASGAPGTVALEWESARRPRRACAR